MNKARVFINGQEGTTGLRIFDRLRGRADIELLEIADELRKNEGEQARLMNESDITFLCLPDEAARRAVELITNDKTRVIDASTAHRVSPGWDYGFPELSPLHRQSIAKSKRIANPGCHASGFIAIVYPLIKLKILSPSALLSCFSLTGYSGGGKAMIAEYEEAKRQELFAPRQYSHSQRHKHLKEMISVCSLQNEPVFIPVADNYYSGMQLMIPLFCSELNSHKSPAELLSAYCEYYAGSMVSAESAEGFSENGFIASNALSGSDTMKILVGGNEQRIVVSAVFDNLGKGASGAAVQCMNIMLGIDEKTGLNIGR